MKYARDKGIHVYYFTPESDISMVESFIEGLIEFREKNEDSTVCFTCPVN